MVPYLCAYNPPSLGCTLLAVIAIADLVNGEAFFIEKGGAENKSAADGI